MLNFAQVLTSGAIQVELNQERQREGGGEATEEGHGLGLEQLPADTQRRRRRLDDVYVRDPAFSQVPVNLRLFQACLSGFVRNALFGIFRKPFKLAAQQPFNAGSNWFRRK